MGISTIKFIPHPKIFYKYKKIVILFFLILGFLPQLTFIYYILKGEYFEIINFVESLAWYIIYATGTIKGIDILLKSYKFVFFHPKILMIQLAFFIFLFIPPLFILIFVLFLLMGTTFPLLVFASIFIMIGLPVVMLVSVVFSSNFISFLSVYAEILYLSDIFSGKVSSTFFYIKSTFSKLWIALKFSIARSTMKIPAMYVKSKSLSKLVDIMTVFSALLIILEKLSIKDAIKKSTKMAYKHLPEIEFFIRAPTALVAILGLVLIMGSLLVSGLIVEKTLFPKGIILPSLSNFLIVLFVFLLFFIPSIFVTFYFAGVASAIQDMVILLFYLKLKGYPINLNEIKKIYEKS